jgi:hypothetical protein
MTTAHHKFVLLGSALFLLLVFHRNVSPNSLQATPWLTDEQARDVAAAAIHSVYPEPCYSTYRYEHLESILLDVRKNPIVGNLASGQPSDFASRPVYRIDLVQRHTR